MLSESDSTFVVYQCRSFKTQTKVSQETSCPLSTQPNTQSMQWGWGKNVMTLKAAGHPGRRGKVAPNGWASHSGPGSSHLELATDITSVRS